MIKQTVKFYTLGCKVNQYETQLAREQFAGAGFREINNGHRAGVYVINTCTVTHRADAESLHYIRRARRKNPSAKILVTGCLTELDANKIKKIDAESLIVKNKNKADILRRFFSRYPQIPEAQIPTLKGISNFSGHTRAFLKIQDGCNYFCSYCKVPLVRGRSRSRPLKEIVSEARNLVSNGFKEIVLCGICLGAYGKDLKPQSNLVGVCKTLENIDGLLRIRLSSIEPGHVSQELIDSITESRKLCRHLHIPLQSGNDRILEKMQRKYTAGDYLDLINKIKKKLPLLSLTTDVLVGFPEESEADFRDTMEMIKEIAPLKMHIFPYSRREKTLAADNAYSGVEPWIIKERMLRLEEIASACALRLKKRFLGQKLDVLIEDRSKGVSGFWQGHTDNYLKVGVASRRDLKNRLIKVSLNNIKSKFILAKISE